MNLLLGLPLKLFSLLGRFFLLLLRFLPFLLLAVPLLWLWKRRSGERKTTETPKASSGKSYHPHFHGPVYTVDYREVDEEAEMAEPDLPQPFGQKPLWMLVRSRDSEAVMDALGLRTRKSVNWKSGLAAVSGERCFVSPSLDGWVILVGGGGQGPERARLEQLSRRFSSVQCFQAQEEKAFYAWGKFENGCCRRAYSMGGGQVLWDEGELTVEEIRLGFGRFPRKNTVGCEGFPTREDVLNIAAAWGMDPQLEGKDYPLTRGWLCEIG